MAPVNRAVNLSALSVVALGLAGALGANLLVRHATLANAHDKAAIAAVVRNAIYAMGTACTAKNHGKEAVYKRAAECRKL